MKKLIYNGILFGNPMAIRVTQSQGLQKLKFMLLLFYSSYRFQCNLFITIFTMVSICSFITFTNIKLEKQVYSLQEERFKKNKQIVYLTKSKIILDSLHKDKDFKRFCVFKESNIEVPKHIDIQNIDKIRENYKIPINLFYRQMKIESNFDHSAVSNKGAKGLLQIMPKTEKEIENAIGNKSHIEKACYYLTNIIPKYTKTNNLNYNLGFYNGGFNWQKKSESKKYVKFIIDD